jgi:hypothetical protein
MATSLPTRPIPAPAITGTGNAARVRTTGHVSMPLRYISTLAANKMSEHGTTVVINVLDKLRRRSIQLSM